MSKFFGIYEIHSPTLGRVRGAGPRYAMAGTEAFSEEIQACITSVRRSSVHTGGPVGEGGQEAECPFLTRTVVLAEGGKNRV